MTKLTITSLLFCFAAVFAQVPEAHRSSTIDINNADTPVERKLPYTDPSYPSDDKCDESPSCKSNCCDNKNCYEICYGGGSKGEKGGKFSKKKIKKKSEIDPSYDKKCDESPNCKYNCCDNTCYEVCRPKGGKGRKGRKGAKVSLKKMKGILKWECNPENYLCMIGNTVEVQ